MRKLYPLFLFLLAVGFYALYLNPLEGKLYDEKYYLNLSQQLIKGEAFEVAHPPLGIALIAGGIKIFGDNFLGWRFFSLLAGALGLVLVYYLGFYLAGWQAGVFASLLLLVDPLYLVMSRLAMLDIFLTCFLLAFFLAFACRKDFLAGIFLGLAISCKWSALFVLLGFLIYLLWQLWVKKAAFSGFLKKFFWLIILPLMLYALIYLLLIPSCIPASFFKLHYTYFHLHLVLFPARGNFSSRWWSWILIPQRAPLVSSSPQGGAGVYFITNPALLWVGAAAFLLGFKESLKKIAGRPILPEMLSGISLPLAGFALLYFPWLFLKRSQFLFYLLPALPFLYLCSALLLKNLIRTRTGKWVLLFYFLFLAGSLVYLYPALACRPWWTP